MDSVITRFAPSPTGFLHLGGVRTALINYIVTKQAKKKNSNSKFLLRIEDTDKLRSNTKFIDSIINGLEWLNIEWDDEIYIQSKNISRHKEIAYKLLEKKSAYKCICSKQKIDRIREYNLKNNLSIKRLCNTCEFDEKIQNLNNGYCIRIKINNEGSIIVNDFIQGEVKVNNSEIDNFILLRQDSSPTYMLSVVVDDHDMKINKIIRGDDHLNNAFKQIFIYKQLGWDIPNFSHIPLIHGNDGAKLSKRHGSIDINEFKKLGYIPKSIINNLILLGWSPKDNNEIIEINEIIEKFDVNKLSKSSSIFDYNKLDFFNHHYLQKEENYIYFENFINSHQELAILTKNNKDKLKRIYKTYKSKIRTFFDLIQIIQIYFEEYFVTNFHESLDESFNNLLSKFTNKLKKIEDWDESNLESNIKSFIIGEKIKFISLGKPIRILLTNLQDGPSISSIISILGKDETINRINNYFSKKNH